jgi:hypothetical protein
VTCVYADNVRDDGCLWVQTRVRNQAESISSGA